MGQVTNNKFWDDFINIYRDNPALWKIDHFGYKNKTVKNKSWNLLVQKYKEIDSSANIETVKKRINSIRTCFRRELKKLEESEKYATSESEIYAPSLWYFQKLLFIRDHDNKGKQDINNDDYKMEIIEIPRKRQSESDENTWYTKTNEGWKKFKENQYEEDIDDVSIFAKSWATSFRKLTSIQQIYAKKAIEDILIQGQLGKLNLNSFQNDCICKINASSTSILGK